MSRIYKDVDFEIVKGNDDSETDIVAIVSSETPDRDNDILYSKGMVQQTVPRFLWLHGFDPNYRLPLGKIPWTKVGSTKNDDGERVKVIRAGFKFDSGEFPQTVKRMYQE